MDRRADPSGQILVMVAAALIGLIAMVGLVIDGGHAWGRQRVTQNGADAIAKAGAVVILQWLDEQPETIGDVGCAVETAEAENGVDIDEVQFTDHAGELIGVPVPDCGTAGAIPPARPHRPLPGPARIACRPPRRARFPARPVVPRPPRSSCG